MRLSNGTLYNQAMLTLQRLHRAVDLLGKLPGIQQWRRARYDREFATTTGHNTYRGIFASYAEAEASAPRNKPVSYDNAQSATLYVERMRRMLPSDYPVVFWLRERFDQGARRVLDVGGNIGNSYYAYEKYLRYPNDLQWMVHDLPAVHAVGRTLALEHDPRKLLTFVADLGTLQSTDVLLANGALQFLPMTLTELVTQLSERPAHMIINRLPLHPTRSFFTLQSIGTAYCPYRVLSEKAFVDEVAALGYSLVDRWRVPDLACEIPFEPEHSFAGYQGFYVHR